MRVVSRETARRTTDPAHSPRYEINPRRDSDKRYLGTTIVLAELRFADLIDRLAGATSVTRFAHFRFYWPLYLRSRRPL